MALRHALGTYTLLKKYLHPSVKSCNVQGRSQDLAGGGGGGARIIFFSFGSLHGKAMRFTREFGGMPPPPREIFLYSAIWCVLVSYLDQMIKKSDVFKKFQKLPFFIYKFQKLPFFI